MKQKYSELAERNNGLGTNKYYPNITDTTKGTRELERLVGEDGDIRAVTRDA